jgi:hypothetical protein
MIIETASALEADLLVMLLVMVLERIPISLRASFYIRKRHLLFPHALLLEAQSKLLKIISIFFEG